MEEQRIPCPACGRQYGHLTCCRVKALHETLDRAVAQYGPSAVEVAHISKSHHVEILLTVSAQPVAPEDLRGLPVMVATDASTQPVNDGGVKVLDTDLGSIEEINARRAELGEEFLSLDNAFSDRGFEIAGELGTLSEEEDHLKDPNSRK